MNKTQRDEERTERGDTRVESEHESTGKQLKEEENKSEEYRMGSIELKCERRENRADYEREECGVETQSGEKKADTASGRDGLGGKRTETENKEQ